jgi:hypothetical protein
MKRVKPEHQLGPTVTWIVKCRVEGSPKHSAVWTGFTSQEAAEHFAESQREWIKGKGWTHKFTVERKP